METRKWLAAVLSVFLFLLIAPGGQASAQNPIPGIRQTAQWNSLRSYVNVLQSKTSVPATPAQKATFRQRLSTRKIATNERVKALYSNRLRRVINRDQASERRLIVGIRKKQHHQIAVIRASRRASLKVANGAFTHSLATITTRFGYRIGEAIQNREILRQNLYWSVNPLKRQLILAKIAVVNNEIRQQREARDKAYGREAIAHNERIQFLHDLFASRVQDTRQYYSYLITKVRTAWRVIYRGRVATLQTRRTAEFSLVQDLAERGSGYISQMPAPELPA